MQALEGKTIEQYCILRRLACGGMSEIYLAQDTQNDHTVVIKLVHSSNKEYCERFRYEVQATSTLVHDHILPAFGNGEYQDWCYMVMPYIESGTLSKRIEDGPFSLREAGQILSQLADALQFAHDRGIIHRDLKPSNILLRDGEHLYLADFGLARRLDEDGLTTTGYLIGTPEYMAPELGEHPATVRSDIYAVGVLLYQLLTGEVPFKASTSMGTFLKHIRERVLPPSELNPAIPTAVEEVVLRALAKEPRHRFGTVRELADAYHQAYEGYEKRASASGIYATLLALTSAATQQIRFSQPKKLFPWPMLAIAAFFCCVLIPFSLGFEYYSLSKQPVPSRLQGIDVSGGRPEKVVTVTPTGRAVQKPGVQPTPKVTNPQTQQPKIIPQGPGGGTSGITRYPQKSTSPRIVEDDEKQDKGNKDKDKGNKNKGGKQKDSGGDYLAS